MTALKRIKENTIEKRLLNDRGLPNFNINFYILNKKGDYAGVTMYNATTGRATEVRRVRRTRDRGHWRTRLGEARLAPGGAATARQRLAPVLLQTPSRSSVDRQGAHRPAVAVVSVAFSIEL